MQIARRVTASRACDGHSDGGARGLGDGLSGAVKSWGLLGAPSRNLPSKEASVKAAGGRAAHNASGSLPLACPARRPTRPFVAPLSGRSSSADTDRRGVRTAERIRCLPNIHPAGDVPPESDQRQHRHRDVPRFLASIPNPCYLFPVAGKQIPISYRPRRSPKRRSTVVRRAAQWWWRRSCRVRARRTCVRVAHRCSHRGLCDRPGPALERSRAGRGGA